MTSRMGTAALLGAAALAVHELRYALAGASAPAPGHAYLPLAGLLIALLAGLGLGELLRRIARAREGGAAPGDGPGFRAAWLAAFGALVAVYAGQELLEAALTPGRPLGVAAVLGTGGWIALPLALAAGAIVALVVRGARAIVRAAARRRRPAAPRRRATGRLVLAGVDRPLFPVLAANLAGRAPPLLPLRP